MAYWFPGQFNVIGFPFSFATGAMTNSYYLPPRVNFKNSATYNVTAAIVQSTTNVTWQGYTTTPGDGGRALIDGGTSGAAYQMFNSSGNQNNYIDMAWAHNGGTGGNSSTPQVNVPGSRNMLLRCLVYGSRGPGFQCSVVSKFIECEAYDCNRANVTGMGGFRIPASGVEVTRCISHDNVGNVNNGFVIDQSPFIFRCISYNNGGDGYYVTADQMVTLMNCDSYNNTGNGLQSASVNPTLELVLQNCNFVKNGGLGVKTVNLSKFGLMYNCGFGTGTQTNSLGNFTDNMNPIIISGTVLYPANVTPWVDPANANFSINLAQAKSAGAGNYFQSTINSPTNTVSFPDIGSAQSASTNTTASGGSYTFAQ